MRLNIPEAMWQCGANFAEEDWDMVESFVALISDHAKRIVIIYWSLTIASFIIVVGKLVLIVLNQPSFVPLPLQRTKLPPIFVLLLFWPLHMLTLSLRKIPRMLWDCTVDITLLTHSFLVSQVLKSRFFVSCCSKKKTTSQMAWCWFLQLLKCEVCAILYYNLV